MLKQESLLNEMIEQRKVKKLTKELLIKLSNFKGLISTFLVLFIQIFRGHFDQITNASNKTWENFSTENIMPNYIDKNYCKHLIKFKENKTLSLPNVFLDYDNSLYI